MALKKLGFAIEGASNLKVFGPLVTAAESSGFVPYLLVSRMGGGKPYDVVDRAELLKSFSNITTEQIIYVESGEIASAARAQDLPGVVFINAYSKYVSVIVALHQSGVASFALDYFVNSLYAAAWQGKADQVVQSLRFLTRRLVTSKYWQDLEHDVLPATRQFKKKYIAVGTPVQSLVRSLDAGEERAALGLGTRPVVTCLTPNIRERQLRVVYGWRGRHWLHKNFMTVRRLCQERGWLLVIKGRRKQWEGPFYRRVADLFMLDDLSFYPPVSARLIAASDLVVHFGSMAVTEAAAKGVPTIGIGVDRIDALHGYMHKRGREIIRRELLSSRERTLFKFGQVAASIPFRGSADHFANLADRMIASRQAAAAEYSEYNETFFGKDWTSAPERVLAAVARDL